MSAFEKLVTESLTRIEGKVDGLGEAHAALDKTVALADQRHGFLGAIGGSVSGIATALAAYFLTPRH